MSDDGVTYLDQTARERAQPRDNAFAPETPQSETYGDAPEALDASDNQAAPSGGDEAAIERLAHLSPTEYDRQRRNAAKRLGCRVETLDQLVKARGNCEDDSAGTAVPFDDVKSWPEPVGGAELLDEIAGTLSRHVMLPNGAADAIALWVMHAWTHDAWRVSPLLAITSPEKRCGKTTLLALLHRLVPKAVPTSNITAAALFRAVEKWRPTLLVDEADTFLRQSDELRGILNSGHTVDSAYVVRTVGEDHEPRAFSTWAPKAIALIGKLPATLADRSIAIPLRRRLPADNVERLRLESLDLSDMCRRCARWADDETSALRRTDPGLSAGLNDRAADNWRPLAAIAERAGGDWPERLHSSIASLSSDDGDEVGAGVLLLSDLRDLFDASGSTRLASNYVADELAKIEGRPWPEWRQDKAITANQIAMLLKGFGIRPKGVRIGNLTPKGYKLEQFADAFARYLPSQTATPQQAQHDAVYGDAESATPSDPVASQDAPQAAAGRDGCNVADEIPQPGGSGRCPACDGEGCGHCGYAGRDPR